MFRWTLSPCHMGNRALYCRLPRTSIACMHCTELVCKVCVFLLHLILYFTSNRCQGHRTDLDGDLSKFPRTRKFTEEVVEQFSVGDLWDDFGIVSDVIVLISSFFMTSF